MPTIDHAHWHQTRVPMRAYAFAITGNDAGHVDIGHGERGKSSKTVHQIPLCGFERKPADEEASFLLWLCV